MHAIKGAWVGQTFALATSNDSGGKKSRIRRSKEERKAMVETFIRRYQNLHNGSFPSLNLTHKEVGGSFYTVREIVREIIQENRVLGPAKHSVEEQNNFSQQYPLGSISSKPEIELLSADASHLISHISPHLCTSEQQTLNSTRQIQTHRFQMLDNEQFVADGSDTAGKPEVSVEEVPNALLSKYCGIGDGQVADSSRQFLTHEDENPEAKGIASEKDELFGESVAAAFVVSEHHHSTIVNQPLVKGSTLLRPEDQRFIHGEHVKEDNESRENENFADSSLPAEESLDVEISVATEIETFAAQVPHTTSVTVETFPLRPVSERTHDVDGRSSGSSNSEGKGEEDDSGKNEVSDLNKPFALAGENIHMKLSAKVLERNNGATEETSAEILNTSPEASDCSTTKEPVVLNINGGKGPQAIESVTGTSQAISSSSMVSENPDNTCPSKSLKESSSRPATATKIKTDTEEGNTCKKGSNPTLDRTKLETWEKTSDKSEANPLLALLKSFITAFVKFWTE